MKKMTHRSRSGSRLALGLCAAACLLAQPGEYPMRAAPHPAPAAGARFLAPPSEALEALVAQGRVEILERYGADESAPSRLLVRSLESAAAALPVLETALGGFQVPGTIHLHRRTIDTSAGLGAASSLASRAGAGGGLEIVQFQGPLKPEWIEALRNDGRIPISYIPHNAYLVWTPDAASLGQSGLPLQWSEPLAELDRLSAELSTDESPQPVSLQVVRAGNHEAVVDRIRAMALSILMEAQEIGPVTTIRALLPPGAPAELAAEPEVVWVEPYLPPTLHDERSDLVMAGMTKANRPLAPGYEGWLADNDLDDVSAILVDVTDTGIDTGGVQVVHPGLRGRVAYARDFTGEGMLDDCAGHGTSMAGIIAGAGGSTAQTDAEGYLLGLGVAPTVRVGSTRIFTCSGAFAPGPSFTALVAAAAASGARIGNNSWGGQGSAYNTIDQEYDALVRDANRDPNDGDQPFLPIFSAGNLGPRARSVSWPSTSKNVLSVASSENYRPGFNDGCGVSSSMADHVDHVLALGGRGPSSDGRIKPDVVGPGSHIQSLASRSQHYNGIGNCNPWYPAGQSLSSLTSGTSASAAHVSGAAALASELFRRSTGSWPSPAMLKAILINHTHDLGTTPALPSNTTFRPNAEQGWGRVDLGAFARREGRVVIDQTVVMTATGDEEIVGPMVAEDPNRRVVVTLAWTDAPGTVLGWSFVNDLDLVVESNGQTYFGNVMHDGLSISGGRPDVRNNVEMVVLPAAARNFTVMVRASNIAGDGLPSRPGETDQDFALYVNNARIPAARGQISFVQPGAVCGQPLQIRLADSGLRGVVRTTVSASSGGDQEFVVLDESPPDSGLFNGRIDVRSGAPAAGDGLLMASHGSVVASSYSEIDPDSGQPVMRQASSVARCAPPGIAGLRIARTGDASATIEWRTDRPADSQVRLLPPSGPAQIFTDSKQVTGHALTLTGLAACTVYRLQVSSTDDAGLMGQAPPAPLVFSTGPGPTGRRRIFHDDLESVATGWSHAAAGGPGSIDDWELGHPALAPPLGAGSRAWGTNLDGLYSPGADATLVSPPIDLRDAVGAQLGFHHYVDIAGGQPPASLNDGGWVEITNDGGLTWSLIEPAGGYPDTIDPGNPWLTAGARVYAGIFTGWQTAAFDLSSFSGSIVQVRFHLWQDEAHGGPLGAGWYLDDVEVTAEGSCHEGRLRLDASEYGCSGRVVIHLSDSDMNRTPSIDSVTVQAVSQSGSGAAVLSESPLLDGEFSGTIQLSRTASPGTLMVSPGDQVEVSYSDADDGSGHPAVSTAAALVPECDAPPPPSAVRAGVAGAGRLEVSWDPPLPGAAPDLQGFRVNYDTDGTGPTYSGVGAFQGASPVRSEAAVASLPLTALSSCSPHFVAVTSFDRLGNESAFSPEVYEMPAGAGACEAGRLTVSPASVGCLQSLLVSLSDANADPDPLAPGAIVVEASSPTQPAPLTVQMTETGAATGFFTALLPLVASATPGALEVSQGDMVTIAYDDADDGRHLSRRVQAATSVTDCTPPAITDIRLKGRSSDRATLTWVTDEPSTSVVNYGADPSLGLMASVAGMSTSHEVPLPGLSACGNVYFTITSADSLLNAAVASDAGAPLHFGGSDDHPVFLDDFESGAPSWSHTGLPAPVAGHDEWQLGAPAPGVPGGPGAAFSGSAVWGTDLGGFYEEGADMVLVSPPVSLSGAEAVTLTFMHWYDIHSFPGPPDGFDDGAFVEVSDNGGATWTYIVPAGGYPDRIASNPYTPFGAGGYAGTSGGWQQARFQLDDWVGRTIRLRFHLVHDRADSTSIPRAGWYLDDVQVLVSRPCHDGFVLLDRSEYPCNGSSIQVQVQDGDLNLNPLAAETVAVLLASQAEPAGETLVLHETGAATAIFEGSLPAASVDAPGTLAVLDGDVVSVVYDDADDGTGQAVERTATARVLDCAPPALGPAQVRRVFPDGFEVAWSTDTPSDSRVLFGTDPTLASSVINPALTTQHMVRVGGLAACGEYWFTVASSDPAGNLAREDATMGPRRVRMSRTITLFSETFSGTAPGWTHLGQGDTWSLAGGTGTAVMAPSGSYTRPSGTVDDDFVLVSPDINLIGVSNPRLSFLHSYSFATSFLGGDGGWIEAWDGVRWIRLEPDGGYPGFLDPEAGGAGQRLRGYSGDSAGWVAGQIDLSPVAGVTTRIRFRVFIEASAGHPGVGWRLDDVQLSAETPCRAGRLALGRDTVTCAATSLPVSVHDTDLDLDPLQPDTLAITASSSGGGALQITLIESDNATGLFFGSIPLSATGAPGTLRAAAGDQITAIYQDADDGQGAVRDAAASLPVTGCEALSLSRITLSHDGRGSVVARWKSDRPATSEASLVPITPAGAPAIAAAGHALVEGHTMRLEGVQSCTAYRAAVASEDAGGNRGASSPGAPGLVVEPIDRTILFTDDMEGPDPGWTTSGFQIEWQRGIPSPSYQDGPATAVSGSRVYGTDLLGSYNGGTNSTLISPRIDLSSVTSARLRFWHWYDIYADEPPNSFDDSGWVEVAIEGINTPVYIEPIGGYTDLTDSVNGDPLVEGTPVFAGQSGDWELVEFDLTPFAGKAIRIRFRLWNDVNELILNNITGAGWYLDDVEVSTARFCHPSPALAPAPPITLTQGTTTTAQIDGSGFREGAIVTAGMGVTISSVVIQSATRISMSVAADALAAPGPRELKVVNPDGQIARLPDGVSVAFAVARADLNGSGAVDGADLMLLGAAFGTRDGDAGFDPAADLNADGNVDGVDLALLASVIGQSI